VDWLEEFWGDLLSEEPLRIVAAWATLDHDEKETIHAHLVNMAHEAGWADVQRLAALAALAELDNKSDTDSLNQSAE